MELTQAQRAWHVIRFLMKEMDVSQQDISEMLGYKNPTVLSQIINGKKVMPQSLPEKIAALDPRINVDFIRGSTDEMLLSNGTDQPDQNPPSELIDNLQHSSTGGVFLSKELVQMFSDLSSTIKDQQATINKIVDHLISK